jgi:hypothetical protein
MRQLDAQRYDVEHSYRWYLIRMVDWTRTDARRQKSESFELLTLLSWYPSLFVECWEQHPRKAIVGLRVWLGPNGEERSVRHNRIRQLNLGQFLSSSNFLDDSFCGTRTLSWRTIAQLAKAFIGLK